MRLKLAAAELTAYNGGLEIKIDGYKGDSSANPTQVFIEFYAGKLAVHVWDGSSAIAHTHTIQKAIQMQRCPHCQDRPGYDGLGRVCKTCKGKGETEVPMREGSK
jgi:hypothetical protein